MLAHVQEVLKLGVINDLDTNFAGYVDTKMLTLSFISSNLQL
jgi:hypothetical protein